MPHLRVDRLVAALPDAKLEVLTGQQHIGMDTAPQVFVEAVLRFLREGVRFRIRSFLTV